MPSSHSRAKEPQWKHPHTLLCVIRVHKIVLTSPSSHSRGKEPQWKHPHTLLCVIRVHKIVVTSPSSHLFENIVFVVKQCDVYGSEVQGEVHTRAGSIPRIRIRTRGAQYTDSRSKTRPRCRPRVVR